MADFTNFEAEADFCKGTAEDVGDEVRDFSDVGSENSFIDEQDVNTDANFTNILKMLKIILSRF